jgi:hypothetical protein
LPGQKFNKNSHKASANHRGFVLQNPDFALLFRLFLACFRLVLPLTQPLNSSTMIFVLRGVAQVVERLVRDQEAGGSSPLTPTRRKPRECKISRLFYFHESVSSGVSVAVALQ